MNNFAEIKPLFSYKKVAYYSVVVNNNEKSLFEEFIQYQEINNKNKLKHILEWLKIIGEKYGAQSQYFRNESLLSDTVALPPYGIDRPPTYTETGKNKSNSLRLYCLRANQYVVFLFSGAIKSTQKAQDCPNVQKHFLLANELTKAINKAFENKDIRWTEDYTKITIENNYKLNY